MTTTRFGISLDDDLLDRFDKAIEFKGYAARSEAIRDLIRDSLVESEWAGGSDEMVGTITIVYSHHKKELPETLTSIQHGFHSSIISSMHVHLDRDNCLEVLVVRGKSSEIQNAANELIGAKGVKHGKLTITKVFD